MIADGASPAELLGTVVTYAAIGVVWNLGVVGTKKIVTEEGMQWWRLGQAVAVGAVVGGIVAVNGGDPEPGQFEAASGVAVPIVDKAINILRDSAAAGRKAGDGDGEVDPEEVRAAVQRAFDRTVLQSMATEDLEDEHSDEETVEDRPTDRKPVVIEEGP